jgi:hypothetical protein
MFCLHREIDAHCEELVKEYLPDHGARLMLFWIRELLIR